MAKYLFLAPGSPLPFSPLSPEAFEEIKHHSGKAWKEHSVSNKDCSTTYSGAYGNKELDAVTRCRVAPSSPTRMHRPHPPEVFLVNRLHHLPGHYGNAKQRKATDGFRPHPAFPSDLKAPGDLGKLQIHQSKINHNAVSVPSPVTSFRAIQQCIKQDYLSALIIGSQTGQRTETPSISSQDFVVVPTGTTSYDSSQIWDSETISSSQP
ncbi:uncharacterized protein C4orf51 homolog isoform X2 [Hemicordylus capensis]|uniref:uncharacterized protein C4orf51 homolog isoform X2 n=1 Tax=Hemicordylus capensis TaxID=884348 RepID=UPI00230248DA|nr:uncharacterized protein C4orf51 homolog isoform X2 [Hemicordylus capensis]